MKKLLFLLLFLTVFCFSQEQQKIYSDSNFIKNYSTPQQIEMIKNFVYILEIY